ncbi:hypothetical protein WMY93_021895 [Mugilogobius chulae]|uniref:Uncharacterized protein n=1 Tax=Mugilogobius chulae TaxID=88201 RepID=A0AAW0ND65_9GOBI
MFIFIIFINRYNDNMNQKRHPLAAEGQSSIESFVTRGVQLYNQGHPRQKAITEALILELIIACNLPLSLVENTHFRSFMSVVDQRYNPVSRSVVNRRLNELAKEMDLTIKQKLDRASTVNVTVDIWTDRSMRGYLGVTAHFIEMETRAPTLKSVLLRCDRFTGSHTDERIHEKFEEMCEYFNIRHKLDYIICDNAANMKKAFTTSFPSEKPKREETDELENAALWEELADDFQEDVDAIQSSCRQQRLQCFAHTLQLVVRDGLKETKSLNIPITKVSKLWSMLHSACKIKEAFEETFGANRSIPGAVSTRWNSTLCLVDTVTNLDLQTLNTLLETQGHKELCLSTTEWSHLNELVEVLSPFLQATDLTQGEKVVSISAALPCVLSLNSHLMVMQNTTRYLVNLVKTLQVSLRQRFQGIFVNVKMDHTPENTEPLPFGNAVYMMSALLDPSFCFFWLEQDVHAPDEAKNQVKQMIMDLILAETCKGSPEKPTCETGADEEKAAAAPAKVLPRLFSGYRKKHTLDYNSSVQTELMRYIAHSTDEDEIFFVGNNKFSPTAIFLHIISS